MCRLEERNMSFKSTTKFCMFCIPLWFETSALTFLKDAGNKNSN